MIFDKFTTEVIRLGGTILLGWVMGVRGFTTPEFILSATLWFLITTKLMEK